MKKKDENYRAAVEQLRQKHADKLESIFTEMYAITQNHEAEDKDRVNAAKTCVSILGVPRTGVEKPPEKPPTGNKEKPTLSKEHNAVLDDILGKL